MGEMSIGARVYVGLTVLTGATLIAANCARWESHDLLRYFVYLAGIVLAANMKVQLPGVTGTVSVSFTFILLGVVELTFPETLTIACIGTLAQVFWRAKSNPLPIQVFFNLASITIAVELAYLVYHSQILKSIDSTVPLLLLVSTTIYFLVNTLSVSGIIALTEKKTIWNVWRGSFLWTAPQWLVGAALAALMHYQNRYFGWQSTLLTCPVIYLVYRSLGLYLGRIAEEKKHAAALADLHWRTIETLASAIEAKDENTHQHLRRVRIYATEIGKEMGLSPLDMQAIEAAALLHDIGKLAVPEYIISKPGKLTPEEFEKMKIHPAVGADILERVGFPYPVVPIVRAHHEKWNGTGYPSGLQGEQIPLGARIISVVDCLDALASERQYRRALPLDEAIKIVNAQSGTSFDPSVLAVLNRRYVELEQLASQSATPGSSVSIDVAVEKGDAPAAGFECSQGTRPEKTPGEVTSSIAAARQEFQSLLEINARLGNLLSGNETLSLLVSRLKNVVPCDSLAIFTVKDECLITRIAQGEDARFLSSLRIPVGQGLSGWVVENSKPIINGNPSVESGYLNDPKKFSTLRSAISLPLEQSSGVVGAITLYSLEPDFFTREDLNVLSAVVSIAGKIIASAVESRFASSEDEFAKNIQLLERVIRSSSVESEGLRLQIQ